MSSPLAARPNASPTASNSSSPLNGHRDDSDVSRKSKSPPALKLWLGRVGNLFFARKLSVYAVLGAMAGVVLLILFLAHAGIVPSPLSARGGEGSFASAGESDAASLASRLQARKALILEKWKEKESRAKTNKEASHAVAALPLRALVTDPPAVPTKKPAAAGSAAKGSTAHAAAPGKGKPAAPSKLGSGSKPGSKPSKPPPPMKAAPSKSSPTVSHSSAAGTSHAPSSAVGGVAHTSPLDLFLAPRKSGSAKLSPAAAAAAAAKANAKRPKPIPVKTVAATNAHATSSPANAAAAAHAAATVRAAAAAAAKKGPVAAAVAKAKDGLARKLAPPTGAKAAAAQRNARMAAHVGGAAGSGPSARPSAPLTSSLTNAKAKTGGKGVKGRGAPPAAVHLPTPAAKLKAPAKPVSKGVAPKSAAALGAKPIGAAAAGHK